MGVGPDLVDISAISESFLTSGSLQIKFAVNIDNRQPHTITLEPSTLKLHGTVSLC